MNMQIKKKKKSKCIPKYKKEMTWKLYDDACNDAQKQVEFEILLEFGSQKP